MQSNFPVMKASFYAGLLVGLASQFLPAQTTNAPMTPPGGHGPAPSLLARRPRFSRRRLRFPRGALAFRGAPSLSARRPCSAPRPWSPCGAPSLRRAAAASKTAAGAERIASGCAGACVGCAFSGVRLRRCGPGGGEVAVNHTGGGRNAASIAESDFGCRIGPLIVVSPRRGRDWTCHSCTNPPLAPPTLAPPRAGHPETHGTRTRASAGTTRGPRRCRKRHAAGAARADANKARAEPHFQRRWRGAERAGGRASAPRSGARRGARPAPRSGEARAPPPTPPPPPTPRPPPRAGRRSSGGGRSRAG